MSECASQPSLPSPSQTGQQEVQPPLPYPVAAEQAGNMGFVQSSRRGEVEILRPRVMAQLRRFPDAIYLTSASEQGLLTQQMFQSILEWGVPPTWSDLLLFERVGHAAKAQRTEGGDDAAVHDRPHRSLQHP